MKIVVDNREHSLIKLLKALNNDYEYNIPIVVEKMDLGDIAIHFDDEEIILMERKKLSDLASSIRDGRYKEQSYRLNGNSLHNHNIILRDQSRFHQQCLMIHSHFHFLLLSSNN